MIYKLDLNFDEADKNVVCYIRHGIRFKIRKIHLLAVCYIKNIFAVRSEPPSTFFSGKTTP